MWTIKELKMNVIRCFSLFAASMLLLVSCTDDSSYTYGVWKERSDMDGKARYAAAAFTIGNKGYICGGIASGTGYTGFLKDLWEYDVNGDYWTQRASLPTDAPARTSAVGFASGGKGYITTGINKTNDGVTFLTDTWEYDPVANNWTRKDDFMGSARQEALAFAVGNYGYVGTGQNDDEGKLKDFYRFDPSAATGSQWTIVTGFGGNKRIGGTAFVIKDVAYICTGTNNSPVYDMWKFDPAKSEGEQWTKLRDIKDSSDESYDDDYTTILRSHAVSFVIDNKGYLVTGTVSNSNRSDYWVYDPETDLWNNEDFTLFEGTNRSQAVAFSTGTRGFVTTGISGSVFLDDTWELLPYELEED